MYSQLSKGKGSEKDKHIDQAKTYKEKIQWVDKSLLVFLS